MEAIRDVLERWNAEIADVLVRVDSALADASARGQAVIPHIVWDLTPLEQPWQAVEHQMHQYREQIEAVWNRISDELAEFEGLPEGLMWQEGWKRDRATSEIEIRYTRAHRLAVAAAADVMRHRALQADVRTCLCVRCGALLDRIRLSGMALDIECGRCHTVNTVEPGPALRMFAAVGAMALAERQALDLWEAKTRALRQINDYREREDVPLELLREYERAARGYWTERLTAEADLAPEQRPFVAQKIESSMKSVNKTLRQYWQWRRFTGG